MSRARRKKSLSSKTRAQVPPLVPALPEETPPAENSKIASPRNALREFLDQRQRGLLALLLAVATLAVYLPVINYPFVVYDDGDYVVGNVHVNSGVTWDNIRWDLTGIASGNWHPVTWL